METESDLTDERLKNESLENGRKLFSQNCAFMAAAQNIQALPPMHAPEVAFAGRSNVGKSSLINALTSRRMLARTSQTPGRTKQLNFFDLAGRICLVDLPGYGYAKSSKTEIKAWTSLTLAFLKGRQNLRRVFLLIDSRRGVGKSDREIMEIFDTAAVSWGLVLTKIDKIKDNEIRTIIEDATKEAGKHTAAWPGIFTTSSQKTLGIAELRSHIAELAWDAPAD